MADRQNKREALRKFIEARNAMCAIEKALLDMVPHIYTEKMGDRVCLQPLWKEIVLRDAQTTLLVLYEKAGPAVERKP